MADKQEEQEQDEGTVIPVADKMHPTLGATEEEQDVSSLNRIVVPVGAHTDPSNPASASASVNLTLDASPVEHSEDYGVTTLEEAGVEADKVEGTMDVEAAQLEKGASTNVPQDRDEWTKADWQAQATSYGLSTQGNMDTIIARVEEHEATTGSASGTSGDRLAAAKEMNAGDWISQINDADDQATLDDLRSLYDDSGASFSTVEQAFDRRESELS